MKTTKEDSALRINSVDDSIPSGGESEESIEKYFMHDWIEACNLQINLRSDGKLT